jgi:thymidylate synthase (FAD)
MKIELIHNTPLWVAAKAIRKCWASEGKSDTIIKEHSLIVNEMEDDEYGYCTGVYGKYGVCGENDKELINRVGNKFKHASTLEHLVYTFDIDGISRACLQEVARHRMASYSVKSTRYTLKELKDEGPFVGSAGWDRERVSKFCVLTPDEVNELGLNVNKYIADNLDNLRLSLQTGMSNDLAKYCLPEAYKTSLVMTINARSLQNFLSLRTSKSALWEIRDLANAMYEVLPKEHKYLFIENLNES